MTEDRWLWIGVIGFALGFLGLLFAGWNRRTREEENHWLIHLFVVLTAFTAYLVMASGGGRIAAADGHEVFVARYVDWSITTPLLLLGLALTALSSPFRRWALVLGLLATDAYMIITGLLADLAPAGSALKWTWYLVSSGAFLFIYLCLFGALRQEARTTGRLAADVYNKNVAFLALVWLAYPIVWLVGPEGLKLLAPTPEMAVYVVLDLVAKVVFGFYSFANSRRRTTLELERNLLPEYELRPAPVAFEETRHPVSHDEGGDKRG